MPVPANEPGGLPSSQPSQRVEIKCYKGPYCHNFPLQMKKIINQSMNKTRQLQFYFRCLCAHNFVILNKLN